MTDNLDNMKAIKDVQATSKEAARLLANLEGKPKNQDATYLRQETVNQSKSADSTVSSDLTQTANSDGCIVAAILLLGLFLMIAIAHYSQQSNGQSGNAKMNNSQKRFYDKTITKANNAVLKKEHESAIVDLKALKNGPYKKLIGFDNGLINNKIIQAKKKIKFLDQPGDDKYWEGVNYGYQWFDKHTNNQFRVFFAYSKKCSNPLITFAYRPPNSTRSRNPVKTTNIKPKYYISTILVPTYRGNSLWLENFKCN